MTFVPIQGPCPVCHRDDQLPRIEAARPTDEQREKWLGDALTEAARLRAQRDAWKEVAEHQYGLLRAEKFGDTDYPVTGALDAWAAERHPVLAPNT